MRPHSQARGLDGGDDGAAADGRGELVGLDFLAELGEAFEADEDQIFKRLDRRRSAVSLSDARYERAAACCCAMRSMRARVRWGTMPTMRSIRNSCAR